MSLPPATIKSVLVNDFADANEEVAPLDLDTEEYYPCCGKSACGGCIHSILKSDNKHKCPFCNSHRGDKTAMIASSAAVDEVQFPQILEGGSFHTNGNGTFLTTEECLLHTYRGTLIDLKTLR